MEKEKDKVKELRKVEQLKEFRERVGLTQGELSKALSVANNTVSRWELGQRSIPEFLPLALETIERRLSESTAGSKVVSTVGSVDKKISSTVGSSDLSESDNENIMTVADALSKLEQIGKKKSETSLRRYLKSKKLKGERVSGEWQIEKPDFENFINSDFFKILK
jgi:transcriptional regulator with XRE-family HTH domain